MITAKIDVTKIDKSKLFQGKNGAKYLDIVLFETPDDKYGNDYRICQSVSKEERAKGVKGAILGNGKKFSRNAAAPQPADDNPPADDDTSVPF